MHVKSPRSFLKYNSWCFLIICIQLFLAFFSLDVNHDQIKNYASIIFGIKCKVIFSNKFNTFATRISFSLLFCFQEAAFTYIEKKKTSLILLYSLEVTLTSSLILVILVWKFPKTFPLVNIKFHQFSFIIEFPTTHSSPHYSLA